MELLLDGPRSANDIASEFDLNRPTISEHVHVLEAMGLLSEQACGRQRFYRLNAAPLSEVRDWLRPFEHYWRRRIRALSRTLDEEESK